MENNIIRNKWKFLKILNKKQYPFRFKKKHFEIYRLFEKDNKIVEIKKLKNGINPKTNRKIKIGGKTYNKILYDFYIFRDKEGEFICNKCVDELEGIDENTYMDNSKKIINKITEENIIIKIHNLKINETLQKINNLKNWDDFIIYDGKKFGTDEDIIDKKHVENNCNGLVKKIKNNGCNDCCIYNYHCIKCDYKIEKVYSVCRDCSNSKVSWNYSLT